MRKIKADRKYDIIVFTFILLFFIIKLISLFNVHDIRWDESVYIGMGKYIYSQGNVGLWEIIRPIGLPLILGFFWKIGLNIIIVAELISILFSLGCLWMVYLIGKEIFDQKTGIVAFLLLLLTPIFFYYSSFAFTGIPSTFFALVSLYSFIKRNIIFTGIFSALSFLFRFPQGILLISFLIILYLSWLKTKQKVKLFYKKQTIKFLIAYTITVLPFLIFNYFLYGFKGILKPFIEASKHQANIVESVFIGGNIASYFYNIFYYFVELFKQNIFLILFFIIALFYFFKFKNYKNIKINALFVVFTLFLVYFSYIINKQIRFALVFLPYLCLISSYGFFSIINTIMKKKKNLRIFLFSFLIIFILITLILSVSRIIEEYNWRTKEEPSMFEFYKFFNYYKTNDTILTTNPIPVAYSDIRMVHFYNNVDDAIDIYKKNKDKAKIIIYSSEFYPCIHQNCFDKKNWLFKTINSTNILLFHEKYDQDYYIYLNKDFK